MEPEPRPVRSNALVLALALAGALLCAGFAGLGAWQVERLGWKQALMARVERNLAAEPVPAPSPAGWAALGPADEYRRLSLQGEYDFDREVLVAASTELGPGFWVLTPLRTPEGHWILVNRGFVPPALRSKVPQGPAQPVAPGLLRWSGPGGGILQANDPAAGRWYSRDVAAIAAAQGLDGPVAPFFVDLQAVPGAAEWPRAGLTVIRFRNHHLVYALTWFALAAAVAGATVFLLIDARRQRRKDREDAHAG